MIAGTVVERTFNPNEKYPTAFVERKDMEYSYSDGDLYYFMDQESYELMPINKDVLGDNFKFVKENMICKVISYKGKVFGVEPPNFVELQVTKTDPGFKGDTATNATKPATLETGRGGPRAPLYRRRRDDPGRYPHWRLHGARIIPAVLTQPIRGAAEAVSGFSMPVSPVRAGQCKEGRT